MNTANAGVLAATPYEINQKTVNALHLKILELGQSYSPSSSEVSQIRSVAEQCLLIGGKSVYQARAMMESFTGEVFGNKDACIVLGERAQPVQTDNVIRLQPNPSSGKVTISATTLRDLVVLDALGHIMFQIKGQNDAQICEFNVGDWPTGIYFAYICDKFEKITVQKLVVTK